MVNNEEGAQENAHPGCQLQHRRRAKAKRSLLQAFQCDGQLRAHITQRVQALLQIDIGRRHASNHDGTRIATQRVLRQHTAGTGQCVVKSKGTRQGQSKLARLGMLSLLLPVIILL